MEPNKIEKQFKEQLSSREIQPSEMAWDKLDAMLTAAGTKTKRNFRWLYAAASILGFLLVTTMYFNRFQTVEINKHPPIVVEQKTDKNILEEPIGNGVNPRRRIKEKTVMLRDRAVKAKSKVSDLSKQLKHNEEKILTVSPSKENVVVSSSEHNKMSIRKYKYISAEELLAAVSDAKVEIIATQETVEKTRKAITVNPNDLLLNAENELNKSYRESALDRLTKKTNAVKTVLVNRNYEE